MVRKKVILTGFAILTVSAIQAQVTIGADREPKATLEIVGKPSSVAEADGVIMPRLTGDELTAKDNQYTQAQTSAMVYVTAPATLPSAKTKNVAAAGYYYFDGSLWQAGKILADNGLTVSGKNTAQLGGNLIKPTTISGGSNPLAIATTAANGFSVDSATLSVDGGNHRVGIGTTAPTAPLHIKGAIRIQDGTQGAKKVLTSDNYGAATWQFPVTPMLTGVIGNNLNRTVLLEKYSFAGSVNIANTVEVPETYIDLPKGKWALYHFLPVIANFQYTTAGYLSMSFGFADANGSGNWEATKMIQFPVASGFMSRTVILSIIHNNSNAAATRYTLRIGNFSLRNSSGALENLQGKNYSVNVLKQGVGGFVYAIKIG